MAKYYDIDTSVRINGGLIVNGDISIPSNSLSVGGILSGNQIKGDGSGITNLSSSAMTDVLKLDGTRSMTGTLAMSDNQIRLRGSADANHIVGFTATSINGEDVNGPRIAGYNGVEIGKIGTSPKTLARFYDGNIMFNTSVNISGNIGVTGTVDGVDLSAFKSSYDSHYHDERYYTETEVDSKLQVVGDYLQGQFTMTGGGTVTWLSSYHMKWTARFIVIPIDKDQGSSGYIDIYMPASGATISKTDGTTVTVTADGIPLSSWDALYAVHTVDGASNAVELKVVNYHTTPVNTIQPNWILVGVRGEHNNLKLGTGQILALDDSLTNGKPSISHINGLQSALDGKELAFTKNSGFNKSFGTTAGTVAEGNHNHNTLYLGISSKAVDSDKLDGLDSTQFVRQDTSTTLGQNVRIISGANSTWGGILSIGGDGHNSGTKQGSVAVTNGNLHLDSASGTFATYINWYNGTGGLRVGNGDSTAPTTVFVVSPTEFLYKGNTIWHAGNDGAGSSLDADTVDGYHVDGAGTGWNNTIPLNRSDGVIEVGRYIDMHTSGGSGDYSVRLDANTEDSLNIGGISNSGLMVNGNTVWNAGNDGSGSGLDADTVDGVHANNIVQTDGGTTDSSLDVDAYQGTYLWLKSNLWTNKGPTGHNGTAFLSLHTHTGDYHSQLWFDTSGDNFYHRTRNAGTIRPWAKVWTSSNDGSGSGLDSDTVDGVQASQLIRNDTTNQSVESGFTAKGTMYIGVNTGSGVAIVRTGTGSAGIQLAGDNGVKLSGVGSYIKADGNAEFSGQVKANSLNITSTSMVANLNSEMVGGKKEKELAKNLSVFDLGGKGVHSGMAVEAQAVPNMTVKVRAGIVYTNTGMRIAHVDTDLAISNASATYDRKDVVYIKGSSASANEGELGVATGTPSATPAEPSIPSDAVKLAVLYIPVNSGSIQSSQITDARIYKQLRRYDDNSIIVDSTLSVKNISSFGSTVDILKPVRNSKTNISLTFTAGQTSKTWTHNIGLGASYVVKLSCNSSEPHVFWNNKGSNSVDIKLDDACETDVVVDVSIEYY